MKKRKGPAVVVEVRYMCDGCEHSRTVLHGDVYDPGHVEEWFCDEPTLVADYGCGQFVSYRGEAAPICPYRDDDQAREAKKFHREVNDYERSNS